MQNFEVTYCSVYSRCYVTFVRWAVSGQRLGRHAAAATVTYATGETGVVYAVRAKELKRRELGQPVQLRIQFRTGGCEDRT
jgi:hypothetical protein